MASEHTPQAPRPKVRVDVAVYNYKPNGFIIPNYIRAVQGSAPYILVQNHAIK